MRKLPLTAAEELLEIICFSLRGQGNFQARFLLTLFYVALSPLGLAIRLFSDPLHIKRRPTAAEIPAHSAGCSVRALALVP